MGSLPSVAPAPAIPRLVPVLMIASELSPPEEAVTPLPVDTSGIPNDHLEYAVTWFSLAAIWAVMTAFFISRQNRATKEAQA